MNITVGVSDAKTSNHRGDVLATYALGSCIAVTLYDPAIAVGGMLHFQLPTATADTDRGRERPLMFADTGMEWLLARMLEHGAQKRRMRVRMAGGASMLNDAGFFDIGKRNHTSIRKVLWKHGLLVESEAIGGTAPRTIFLNIADGDLAIKTAGETVTV